jgi:hypothetical protein
VKDTAISSLPDAPSDGGGDRGRYIAWTTGGPELGEARGSLFVEIRVEELPYFEGLGALKQEMGDVFVLRAGKAGGAGAEVVSKPPLIGGEAFLPG